MCQDLNSLWRYEMTWQVHMLQLCISCCCHIGYFIFNYLYESLNYKVYDNPQRSSAQKHIPVRNQIAGLCHHSGTNKICEGHKWRMLIQTEMDWILRPKSTPFKLWCPFRCLHCMFLSPMGNLWWSFCITVI